MNLARAKTILIYAFLGLNIFLAYHLIWANTGVITRTAFTMEELDFVESQLAMNNIFLKTSLKRNINKSAFITVKQAENLQRGLMEELGGPWTVTPERDCYVYRGSNTVVTVFTNGLVSILFEDNSKIIPGARELEEKDLLRQVELLLEQHKILPPQAQFDRIEDRGSTVTLHYYQKHDGNNLYAGNIEVVLEGESLVGIDIFWLEPIEKLRENEMEVIPVTEALLRLAAELGYSSDSRYIIKADLGYFSREYNAERWEMPPVWRFVTQEGRQYFFNAFTGNLEIEQ